MANNTTTSCGSSVALSDEKCSSDFDSESDKFVKSENFSPDVSDSPNANVSSEPGSSEEITSNDDECWESNNFFDKYQFSEIKSFIYKFYENNEELRKPIAMAIDVFEKYFVREMDKLTEEKTNIRNKLTEAVRNLAIAERNNQQLKIENHSLRMDIRNAQEKLRKLERRYTSQEEQLRNHINDLAGRFEMLAKERDNLVFEFRKLQAEYKCLKLELDYNDEKSNLLWKSLMPSVYVTGVPKNELIKNLKECESLMKKLQDTSYLESHGEESILNWFELANSLAEMASTPEEMKTEIFLLKKMLHKEKITESLRRDIILQIQGKFGEISKYGALVVNDQAPMQPQESPSDRERRLYDELNALRMDLRAKEELLYQKDKEIVDLRNNMDDFQSRTDEISLLKNQLKTYEEDFILEREAKEALAAEKESLWRQLTQERCLNRLCSEAQRYQEPDEYENWDEPSQVTTFARRHACILPNCKRTFDTAEELQAHVNDCLGK